ncbi:uncharacterized protein LOC131938097 [Physella acuta]|uniref:uncharacterized protein LOC131938097 n=1 Tax=Physella acuta TaxID=109671 RepID=UPI0027DBDAE7|nr:uncharacterized protein LOC131938097 [Physella acuta]
MSAYGAVDNRNGGDTVKLSRNFFKTTNVTSLPCDVSRQPVSVNTFGSILPDVNSEVDLNTTSEAEDRQPYEPNLLERALERSICYNPRRRVKATPLTVVLLCLMTVTSHAAVLIICPIYTSSMCRAGGDAMVVLLSLASVLPLPLILLTLTLKHVYDSTITLRPVVPLPIYAALGICLALRLNLGIYSSHPHHAPAALQPGLSGASIPFSFITTLVITRKGLSRRRGACCLVALVALFIGLEPRIWSLEGSGHGDLFYSQHLEDRILWPVLFSLSFLFLSLYHTLGEGQIRGRKIHVVSLSTSGLLSACVFTVLAFGANFLPWYGDVSDWSEFWKRIKNGYTCNFSYAPECHQALVQLVVLSVAVFGYNLFSLLLVAATEGSLFVALVSSLAAPMTSAFWSLFYFDYSSDVIKWSPKWTHSAIFTIVSTALLLPSAIAYVIFYHRDVQEEKEKEKSDVSSSEYDWE